MSPNAARGQSKTGGRKRSATTAAAATADRGGDAAAAATETDDSIGTYIPHYLRRFVAPCHGDFCIGTAFDPRLIAALMAEGFLPIAAPAEPEGRPVLLPKLHARRCVVWLGVAGGACMGGLHVSRSVRKKARNFTLTVNKSFRDVVRGCRRQHGDSCWLYDPLVRAFEAMHRDPANAVVVLDARIRRPAPCPVRLYSVEVWDRQGRLAGGELGYTVGCIYTSLTGFCAVDGAGSVQLAALGRLLMSSGFRLWDLGMDMEYKRSLGATLMERDDFVQFVHEMRHAFGHVTLPVHRNAMECRDLIDQANDQTTPESMDSAGTRPDQDGKQARATKDE